MSESDTPRKAPDPPVKHQSTESDAPTESDANKDKCSRSRSQSRRARRRRQNERRKGHMPSVGEDGKEAEDWKEGKKGSMQPFQWFNTDDRTSMSGPVTYARAQRGEVPQRKGNPNQRLSTGVDPEKAEVLKHGEDDDEDGEEEDIVKKEGLKLRLELDLDIELELKAKIKGAVTLALLQ